MKATKQRPKGRRDDRRPPDDRPEREGHREDPFDRGQLPDDARTSPTKAKLFIPYFAGDTGDRSQPFPAGVLSWWCPGIRITGPDGTLYTGGKLSQDGPSSIAVDVANGGQAPAWAQVSLFWSDPTAGFGPPFLRRGPELGSPVMVHVAPGTTGRSDSIPLSTVPGTPDHICVIAVVSAFDDPPSGTWDPIGDRHYAQHNIELLEVDEGGIASFSFFVTSPLHELVTATVEIRPAAAAELAILSSAYAAVGQELRRNEVGLTQVDQDVMDRPSSVLTFDLYPGERRLCRGMVAAATLKRGQFSAATVDMTARPARGERDRSAVRGSFGAVIFVNR